MKGLLEVLDGGFQTTVQDAGRIGFRKYGVPVSGVMDEHAYQLVNWLVGNKNLAPVLELTLKGGKFKFHSDTEIGISGGDAEVLINEKPAPTNKTIKVYKDDLLKVGQVRSGCRVYVAIAGDWNIAKVMGSYSTCLVAKFGGVEGRALKRGDLLSWTAPKEKTENKTIPKKLLPHYSARQTIRIIKGPEWEWLSDRQKSEFLATDFSISNQSNRMGIRLKGSFVYRIGPEEMISSPVMPGIIQMPPDGSPIILMQDAQSVGGYPRIAKVIDADLWRLGQVWTGNEIYFRLIDLYEAQKLKKYYDSLRRELKQ